MIYCSLDQSLTCTGWSIWDEDKLIQYGTFKTKPSVPIEERLGTIWKELGLLKDQYEFEYLFFEDIQRQANVETYKKLAYTQATVLLWCYWKECSYTILSPSHWRKILKDKYKITWGKARADQKKAAIDFIKKTCGVSVTSDEADALCIGIAGRIEYNQNKSAF